MTQVQDLLEPLHDLLLVERDPDQEKVGEIYLPGNSSLGKSQLGTVVKAGPRSQPYLGRRIVFSVGAGILLKASGLLLLSPADILALIRVEEVYLPSEDEERRLMASGLGERR